MPRVRTLGDQSDCGSNLHIEPGHVRSKTLPLSASCVVLHRLVRRLSHLAVPSSLLYASVLVYVNTQNLFNQRLLFLSLRAQLILEIIRGYCRRLVFHYRLNIFSRNKITCWKFYFFLPTSRGLLSTVITHCLLGTRHRIASFFLKNGIVYTIKCLRYSTSYIYIYNAKCHSCK